jgi:uncharacterized protein YigE (DUF2233 family)
MFIILIFFLCFFVSSAQVKECQNFNYNNSTFDIAIIKSDTNTIQKFKFIENSGLLDEGNFFDSLYREGFFIACNAGPIDNNNELLGLFIKEGKVVNDINLNSGSGNFFLKPNGYYAFNNSDIEINSSSSYNYKNSFNNAAQSGPMLVLNGAINPIFDKKSPNRNLRLGVGYYKKNHQQFILLVKSKTPVTFYQFADLFSSKFKCENALYLDGGANCSLHLSSSLNNDLNNNKSNKFIYLNL